MTAVTVKWSMFKTGPNMQSYPYCKIHTCPFRILCSDIFPLGPRFFCTLSYSSLGLRISIHARLHSAEVTWDRRDNKLASPSNMPFPWNPVFTQPGLNLGWGTAVCIGVVVWFDGIPNRVEFDCPGLETITIFGQSKLMSFPDWSPTVASDWIPLGEGVALCTLSGGV